MTINVAGKLEFAPVATAATVPGLLELDGAGVVLDGGGSYGILEAVSPDWNLAIYGMTFRNASGDFGGAILGGVPLTSLDSVLFQNNMAAVTGGAIYGNSVSVTGSTFLDSRVNSFSLSSARGGAISASGSVDVVNSTFSNSGIGEGTVMNNGSDVYADGADQRGQQHVRELEGRIAGEPRRRRGAQLALDQRLRRWIRMLGFVHRRRERPSRAGHDLSRHHRRRVQAPVVYALDSDGWIPVFPIQPIDNPAMGAGTDCPATDALGAARPAQGCDLGAVEFPGGTVTTVTAIPSTTEATALTLRATVVGETGAVPSGEVTFTFDGDEYGPVELGALADPTVAEFEITGLTVGETYDYSASYSAFGPFEASASDAGAVHRGAAPGPGRPALREPSRSEPRHGAGVHRSALEHLRQRVHPSVRLRGRRRPPRFRADRARRSGHRSCRRPGGGRRRQGDVRHRRPPSSVSACRRPCTRSTSATTGTTPAPHRSRGRWSCCSPRR